MVASTSRKNLEKGIFDLWDSGKVRSDQSIQIEYGGIPLQSQIYCYWKVRLWNQEHLAGEWSDTAFFSMGLLQKEDWYAGRLGPVRWDENYPLRGAYGLDRRLLLQLEIATDRGKQMLISDDSWKLFEDGPIQSADHFLGQVYDARKQQPGWNMVDFDDSEWKSAIVDSDLQPGKLVAQMNEPVRQIDTLTPVKILEPEEGVYIFDMGQNMVGRMVSGWGFGKSWNGRYFAPWRNAQWRYHYRKRLSQKRWADTLSALHRRLLCLVNRHFRANCRPAG